ncbi:MAG: SH3 domain-containing protein [Bacillota bacterium]
MRIWLAATLVLALFWAGGCTGYRQELEERVVLDQGVAVRKQPSPGAAPVFSVSLGDRVWVVKDKSRTGDDGALWVLIKQGKEQGWSPAVHLVSPGGLEAALAQRYAEVLSRLDLGRLDALETASDAYQRLFALAPKSPAAGEAFRAFLRLHDELSALAYDVMQPVRPYYVRVGYQLSALADPASITDPAARQAVQSLQQAGYMLGHSEGMLYVTTDPEFLLGFAGYVPNALAGFLVLRAEESRRPVASDGALRISWDQLRSRAVAAEIWARDNPGLPETPQAEAWAERYFTFYLRGMDNTPIFPLGSNQLDPELKASYELFLAHNQDSDWYGRVQEFYALLEKNGFARTNQVREYMSRPR